MPITREQLQNLPLDQLQKLLQQVGEEQTTPTTTPMTTQMTTQPRNPIMRGLQTGLRAFPYLATTGKIPSETIESDWLTKEIIKDTLITRRKTLADELDNLENIPEGYKIGYNKQGKKILISAKEPSSMEQYREDLRNVKNRISEGEDIETVFTDLEDKYPEKDFTDIKFQFDKFAPRTLAPSSPKPVGRINPLRMLPGFKHYPTATNPTTGEKIIFKDGKWQPYKPQ